MVEDLAAAKDHEAPSRDASKQLQQAPIAGTVDSGRARNHDLDARSRRCLARHAFAFQLCDLVDVARTERRVLVRGRVLDVPVHAHGAAVDDATGACCCGRLNQRADSSGIDVVIDAIGEARLSIQGGNVVDDVGPGGGAVNRRRVTEIARRELDACRAQPLAARRVAHERADGVAARAKTAREMATREPAAARD